MKRSQVNQIMRESDEFIRSFGYIMPPFAYWSPAEMQARKAEIANIIDAGLGWDISDYGLGNFAETGLFLFTVRNGNVDDLKKGTGMLYAEKAMISRENQYSPMHRHNLKAEDIINRGGGTLVIELFGDTDGKCDRSKGTVVHTDGIRRELEPGHKLRLAPGESVTLMPNEHWHAFWGEGGDVFIGEVSTVNDDNTDNVFEDPRISRFSGIEEDEEPLHLLVSDYPKWLG
ncbi:D-lyxose/D-mannose family sugar isomerase [Mariluticola halotolerans]|uniref:D-lyxose/D-mannose family sugar isomerase n=1 Tax=Mariluticola halotolerans TaxID=2909283 RepID=UPI0026E14307|nr:D-lyxose/D-mannose family sugar isomerase [Mariluticola halotolerans]UJQ95947.1 D-lyxose/D-mannose family sugar isomerase [Mariluticola halotolerans]